MYVQKYMRMYIYVCVCVKICVRYHLGLTNTTRLYTLRFGSGFIISQIFANLSPYIT